MNYLLAIITSISAVLNAYTDHPFVAIILAFCAGGYVFTELLSDK